MKKIFVLLLSVIGLAGFTSCGISESGNTEAPSESANVASESSDVVNIGTQNLVNGDLIAQYEKYYENELGLPVNIIKFESGKDVNTAIAAGSIDIAEIGTAPASIGVATELGYKVFWIGDVIGSAESLAVRNNSGINSVADLKGKKIAAPFSSTAHYSLLNAIKDAGLSETDLTILDLQPADIYAAWQRGDIDGAYVWYPVLDNLLRDGGKVITHSGELAEKGIITADVNIVRNEFAEKHPDVVKNYVKAQIKANDIILNDNDKAAEEVASVLEIDKADAKNQLSQFEYLTADEEIDFIKNKLPETLKNTADFLVEQGSIKSAPDLDTFKNAVTVDFINGLE